MSRDISKPQQELTDHLVKTIGSILLDNPHQSDHVKAYQAIHYLDLAIGELINMVAEEYTVNEIRAFYNVMRENTLNILKGTIHSEK